MPSDARPKHYDRHSHNMAHQPDSRSRGGNRGGWPTHSDEGVTEMQGMNVAAQRLLTGLMQELPQDGAWTAARRDLWLNAAKAIIDLICDIYEPQQRPLQCIGREAWLEEIAP